MNLAVFEPELPALADEIIEAIRAEVPEYRRPMKGEFGRGMVLCLAWQRARARFDRLVLWVTIVFD